MIVAQHAQTAFTADGSRLWKGYLTKTLDKAVAPVVTDFDDTPRVATTVLAPKAPADTKHFVTMVVTLPLIKADFDTARQDQYKAAVASAAGTDLANVEIVSISEARRRAGSIQVDTKVQLKSKCRDTSRRKRCDSAMSA
jgi:hypothetical protein